MRISASAPFKESVWLSNLGWYQSSSQFAFELRRDPRIDVAHDRG